MIKEDWAKIEKALSGRWGHAKLKVDGHEITFQREQSKNNLVNVIYVDGSWKGVWIGKEKTEHPEQRYLCPTQRYIMSGKMRTYIKKLSKSSRKFMGYEKGVEDRKKTCFLPWFTRVATIRRHYEKTFASIELIEVCPS